MPDDTTPQVNFELSEPEEGVARIYANVSHLSWNGMDLTVQLYQLVQPNREIPSNKDAPNELVHEADVTLSWPAAKTFHKLLGDILQRYEKVYGPIATDFKPI